MRRTVFLVVSGFTLAVASVAPAAQAQILGARPGYSNATLKQEHERQRLQALQRQAAQQAAAKAAAEQAAQKH